MKKLIKSTILFSLFVFLLSCSKNDDVVNPQPSNNLPQDFNNMHKIFGDTGIGAGAWLGQDVVVLFDIYSTKYAWLENGIVKDIRKISDNQSIFKNLPQSGPSAAVVLNSKLYVFANGGASYSTIGYDLNQVKGKWNNPSFFNVSNSNFLLTQWGVDYSAPFKSVSAAYSWHPDRHCTVQSNNRQRLFHFNSEKPEITTYNNEDVTFSNTVSVSNHSLYDCTNNLKESLNLNLIVDAAFVYPVNNKVYEVFFFNDGKDFVYSEIGKTSTSKIYKILQ